MLASPGGLQANARSQTHFYAFQVVKLRVPGMHCSTCAPAFQTHLSQTRFHARQEVKLCVSGMHCSACWTRARKPRSETHHALWARR